MADVIREVDEMKKTEAIEKIKEIEERMMKDARLYAMKFINSDDEKDKFDAKKFKWSADTAKGCLEILEAVNEIDIPKRKKTMRMGEVVFTEVGNG